MSWLDTVQGKLDTVIENLEDAIYVLENHDRLVHEAYVTGTGEGYRDGYHDGVADTESKHDADTEAESDSGNHEAEPEGPASEDRPVWTGESLSEVLSRISRGFPGFNS